MIFLIKKLTIVFSTVSFYTTVIHKTSKTAPQSSPKAGKILEKSSCNRRNPQNSSPNHSETAGKIHKKVAVTTEFHKTAPQNQRNSRKIHKKVAVTAEITKVPKTAQKYSLLFIFS